MYTVALFIVMAILLEAVMAVLNSVLSTVKVGDAVNGIPVIGTHLTLIVSCLMVWLLGGAAQLTASFGLPSQSQNWINIIANGAIIAGMIPLKNAVFSAIEKGARA